MARSECLQNFCFDITDAVPLVSCVISSRSFNPCDLFVCKVGVTRISVTNTEPQCQCPSYPRLLCSLEWLWRLPVLPSALLCWYFILGLQACPVFMCWRYQTQGCMHARQALCQPVSQDSWSGISEISYLPNQRQTLHPRSNVFTSILWMHFYLLFSRSGDIFLTFLLFPILSMKFQVLCHTHRY